MDVEATNDLHISKEVCTTMCRHFGAPVVPGVPLEVIFLDLDSIPSTYLHTKSFSKIKTSTADFKLSGRLKTVATPQQVELGGVSPDAMQLF